MARREARKTTKTSFVVAASPRGKLMRAAQSHNSISSATPISRAAARTSPVAMRPEPASSLGRLHP
jgi:hypothetical protein